MFWLSILISSSILSMFYIYYSRSFMNFYIAFVELIKKTALDFNLDIIYLVVVFKFLIKCTFPFIYCIISYFRFKVGDVYYYLIGSSRIVWWICDFVWVTISFVYINNLYILYYIIIFIKYYSTLNKEHILI